MASVHRSQNGKRFAADRVLTLADEGDKNWVKHVVLLASFRLSLSVLMMLHIPCGVIERQKEQTGDGAIEKLNVWLPD